MILLVIGAVATLLFAIVLFYACFNKEEHIMVILYQTHSGIGYKSCTFDKFHKTARYNLLVYELDQEYPDSYVIINVSVI